jgi:hypothetical protein
VAKIPDFDPFAPQRPLSPFEQARGEIVEQGRRQREEMRQEHAAKREREAEMRLRAAEFARTGRWPSGH